MKGAKGMEDYKPPAVLKHETTMDAEGKPLPEKFTMKIQGREDTALLLSFAMLVDSTRADKKPVEGGADDLILKLTDGKGLGGIAGEAAWKLGGKVTGKKVTDATIGKHV